MGRYRAGLCLLFGSCPNSFDANMHFQGKPIIDLKSAQNLQSNNVSCKEIREKNFFDFAEGGIGQKF